MLTSFIKNRKSDILLAFVLTIFIITLAIVITVFFKPLYYFDIDYLKISETTGLSADVIRHNYDILIQYQSVFYQGTLNLPDFVMSTTGRIHFEEVKRIFEVIQITCLISGVISLVMVYRRFKQKEYRFLRLTSIFSVGIPLIIGFLAAIDFNKAFVIFHQIVFRNDYWIFNETTDPVITILPETFFMHSFMMIVGIIIIISVGCYGIYGWQRKKILQNT
ncbi:TIGR01906 family membrane protein [Allocoprobacillus halotolerans]|uniref:TIGR01906 family membrane protein n=1 Tax=Allocoprobacillus halotolerans TaxID=2944914 RepID=A0ABY5I3V4_9FIRM|nr:TIGR01906 family membrane protein [Allocoprobacillus halotolerans]UTY40028.1 TIGR01906 family membrane protein [Allocoprobacillus halotolerans]